jgi:GDP-4-dehydro-6-deoxy-D-mannose reductase
VYHCAGSPHVAESWGDPTTPLANNVMTTHHLLEALNVAACNARVLVPGSATVYAASTKPIVETDPVRPASPYAVAKLAQEQLALRAVAEDGVEVIVTRSFNHTGPRQSTAFAAPSFARQIALIERGEREPIMRVGNLEAQRDLTDVRDVVRAYVALMDGGLSGTIYNVASGVPSTIRSILDRLAQRARVPLRVDSDPTRMRPHDLPVLVGDVSRLREATGWSPQISLDRMLDDLLEYWRARV